MREKAVAACLMAFKFVPDLLLTTKMREILDIVIFSNDDIDLNTIDFNNIQLGDNYEVDNFKTMINVMLDL